LQAQANLLKNMALTGSAPTKIITVGIGVDVSATELERLASSAGNSILLPNLVNVALQPASEQQLINTVFGEKLEKWDFY